MLLEHKADIEAKNMYGKTALQRANGREVVDVLKAAAAQKERA